MKILLGILMGCFLMVSANAQQPAHFDLTYRIPVGEDSLIFLIPQGGTITCSCNSRSQGPCSFGVTEGLQMGMPYYINQLPQPRSIRVIPNKAGSYSNHVQIFYYLLDRYCFNDHCAPLICADSTQEYFIIVYSLFDDKIKLIPYSFDSTYLLNIRESSVSLNYDTILHKYRDVSVPIEIYNNKAAQASFTDWKLSVDPSKSLSLKVVPDSIVVDSFSRQLNILLEFNTLLKSNVTFNVVVSCLAHFNGKDSLCEIPLKFMTLGKPNSTVSLREENTSALKIYPNPSSGVINILYTSKQISQVHLHIFDELGKDIMALYDGILPEGKLNFSFSFSPGAYYIRAETVDSVVTKKMIVE